MTACMTNFISDTINHFIDIFIIVLVLWFLIIATLVIQAQRDSDPTDDVGQEWEAIRYYMGLHIKAGLNKVNKTKTFQRVKNILAKR